MHLGYGPVPVPTLRKALCHTRPVGGTADKYRCSLLGNRKNIEEEKVGITSVLKRRTYIQNKNVRTADRSGLLWFLCLMAYKPLWII